MLTSKDHERWQNDWLNSSAAAVQKRMLFVQRRTAIERLHLSRAVELIRAGRERLVKDYAYIFSDQLQPDSSVATTPHLERLLQLALQPNQHGKPDPQRWFEAIGLFDQAISVAQIEMKDSTEAVGHDLDALIDLLRTTVFEDGFEKIVIYAYHDPKNGYGVKEEDIGVDRLLHREGFVRRKANMTCRRVHNDGIAYMHHRIKDPFRVWLKVQRQIIDGRANPFEINDRCGLMFVVPNVGDLEKLSLAIVEVLVSHGAKEDELLEMNHMTGTRMDAHNIQSSTEYKLAKAIIQWRGRKFEFQFMTFHDYYTSLRSLHDSNHELYKLRQAMNIYLPLLWPEKIYGVEWQNPKIRHLLKEWKIAQLGWRVSGAEDIF